MMKRNYIRLVLNIILMLLCMDLPLLFYYVRFPLPVQIFMYIASFVCTVIILVTADGSSGQAKRTTTLLRGNSLLATFLVTLVIQICSGIAAIFVLPINLMIRNVIGWVSVTVVIENALFWVGIIRLYAVSVQLGIKLRVIGILLGWIPIANLVMLHRIMKVTAAEADCENEKYLLDIQRAESEICRTKYPVLLVHGVFFRDFRYLNYWGRIPRALKANGAKVYYGEQQSAASVPECGRELAEKIRNVVEKTGCEKVNIIAHSKGGLDSRWAISNEGVSDLVASLTTINTPHHGCIFAEELLGKIPAKAQNALAKTYNGTLKRMGDKNPDFLTAVRDLTNSRCNELDGEMPDVEGVFYQSVMSSVAHAAGGKFPLNVAYPLVKHYDGENDGLVSVESGLKWQTQLRLLPPKKRGISHADMIDLYRENIDSFDVREFYVDLVHGLAERGL